MRPTTSTRIEGRPKKAPKGVSLRGQGGPLNGSKKFECLQLRSIWNVVTLHLNGKLARIVRSIHFFPGHLLWWLGWGNFLTGSVNFPKFKFGGRGIFLILQQGFLPLLLCFFPRRGNSRNQRFFPDSHRVFLNQRCRVCFNYFLFFISGIFFGTLVL